MTFWRSFAINEEQRSGAVTTRDVRLRAETEPPTSAVKAEKNLRWEGGLATHI